jgi:hypothetical protein
MHDALKNVRAARGNKNVIPARGRSLNAPAGRPLLRAARAREIRQAPNRFMDRPARAELQAMDGETFSSDPPRGSKRQY